MNSQKLLRNLVLGVLLALSPVLLSPASAGYDIYYCTNMQSGTCQESYPTMEGFFTELSSDSLYYPYHSIDFYFDGYEEYIVYTTPNFEIYISEYALLSSIEEEDYLDDGYITESEWRTGYDQDLNLIHDALQEYVDYLDIAQQWFEEDYGLDVWWSHENRLTVFFDLLSEDSTLFGAYNPVDGQEYLAIDVISFDQQAIKATIIHELFHAVQDSYVDLSYLPRNFKEGSAAMVESKAPGLIDLSYLDLEGAHSLYNPQDSVFGDAEGHFSAYGTFLWYSYLHQEYGKDVIHHILDEFRNMEVELLSMDINSTSFIAISRALSNHEDSNIYEAYLGFVQALYEQEEFTDGEYLPEVRTEAAHSESSGQGDVDEYAPTWFGTNYVVFDDVSDREGYLKVNFNGNFDAAYYISFLPMKGRSSLSRSAVETHYVELGTAATLYFPYDESYSDIVMAVSVVDISDFDTADRFNDYVYPYFYSWDTVDEAPVDTTPNLIFSDLSDAHQNAAAISFLYNSGVISGYPDGSFKPEATVNRAELLKILIEGQGITPDDYLYKDCFLDVGSDWYAKYVCYAKEQGWVEGYPDGNFLPGQTVNKVEALKMLLNSQSISLVESYSSRYSDVFSTEWYAKYVYTAETLGLLEESGETLSPGGDMSRAGICENLYRLLTQ